VTALFSGPDINFPYLGEYDRYTFPDPLDASDNIIAIGGNLSPGMLLSAYEQGIFPWYNPEDPILWQSPDPRCLIFPEKLHVSNSMKKILAKGDYDIYFNRDFRAVITACSEVIRPNQNGTWITNDIIDAYTELCRLGYAHSAEAWQHGKLAGGCYGVLLGSVFSGESMFSKKPNASKAAFLVLAKNLFSAGVKFIDCQVPTPHLCSLGGEVVSRADFLDLLYKTRGFNKYEHTTPEVFGF
jgi:leucyl/phenylalanyl-tRNA--protein transferase